MNNLEEILRDPEQKRILHLAFYDRIDTLDPGDSFRFMKLVEKNLEGLTPETEKIFYDEFGHDFLLLKWRSASMLTAGPLLTLIEKNIVATKDFFEYDERPLDLVEAVRSYLASQLDYDERDKFKILTRQALLANKETVERSGAVITVADWVKYAVSQIGADFSSSLKESNFYLHDKEFERLEPLNKELVRNILNLYKYCLYSSDTPAGFDDNIIFRHDGRLKVLDRGVVSDVPAVRLPFLENQPAENPSTAKYQGLKDKYETILKRLLDRATLGAEQQRFQRSVSLPADFSAALKKKSPEALVAALNTAAAGGTWDKLMVAEEAGFITYLKVRRPGARVSLEKPSPELVALFLQFVLQEKMGLSAEDSAVLAMTVLGNIKDKRERFAKAVYGDIQTGAFKWRDIKIENGLLNFV